MTMNSDDGRIYTCERKLQKELARRLLELPDRGATLERHRRLREQGARVSLPRVILQTQRVTHTRDSGLPCALPGKSEAS